MCGLSLSLSGWVWEGWREPSILPGGNAGDALPRGCCVMGRAAAPLALWLFYLPGVQEERCEAAIATWCRRIPAHWIFIFLHVSLLSYGKLVHSAMLELAFMVNSLTGSQKVSRFHSQRSLSVWIPVCITNFNLWPSGSLRPRLCGVRMTHCWARATFGIDAADVSKGVLLLLQCFLISRQEKSVTPAKAAVLCEFKWHKGFSRMQVLS